MDKEQAKFILRNFRTGDETDGNANSRDLAEALALATANRELGEWLAEEHAMDEVFTRALGTIELPDSLRDDILGYLGGEGRDYPCAEGSDDAAMIGAFASIPVPSHLRGDILNAMERSVPHAITSSSHAVDIGRDPLEIESVDASRSLQRRLSIPLAAAAGIMLALIVTQNFGVHDHPLVNVDPVPIEAVPVSFIQTYESSDFSLDIKDRDHEDLMVVLQSKSLPCPECLPPGLDKSRTIGCRELMINGKQGSLVCFVSGSMGVVHLIIFNNKDVDGSCTNTIVDPCILKEGEWSIARWQSEKSVFFLIGKGEEEQIRQLF